MTVGVGLRPAGVCLTARAGRIVCVAALATLVSCARRDAEGRASNLGSASHHVQMRGLKFDPADLAVTVGDTVQWDNHDVVPHTTVAVDGSWTSESIGPDSSWSTVIERAGAIDYACTFHPAMKGRITAR